MSKNNKPAIYSNNITGTDRMLFHKHVPLSWKDSSKEFDKLNNSQQLRGFSIKTPSKQKLPSLRPQSGNLKNLLSRDNKSMVNLSKSQTNFLPLESLKALQKNNQMVEKMPKFSNSYQRLDFEQLRFDIVSGCGCKSTHDKNTYYTCKAQVLDTLINATFKLPTLIYKETSQKGNLVIRDHLNFSDFMKYVSLSNREDPLKFLMKNMSLYTDDQGNNKINTNFKDIVMLEQIKNIKLVILNKDILQQQKKIWNVDGKQCELIIQPCYVEISQPFLEPINRKITVCDEFQVQQIIDKQFCMKFKFNLRQEKSIYLQLIRLQAPSENKCEPKIVFFKKQSIHQNYQHVAETETSKNFKEMISYLASFKINQQDDISYKFEVWDTYDEQLIGWAQIDNDLLCKQQNAVMLVLQNEDKENTAGILQINWARDNNIMIDETSKDIGNIKEGDLLNPYLKFIMSYELTYQDKVKKDFREYILDQNQIGGGFLQKTPFEDRTVSIDNGVQCSILTPGQAKQQEQIIEEITQKTLDLQQYFTQQRKEYERIVFESKFVIERQEQQLSKKDEYINDLKDQIQELESQQKKMFENKTQYAPRKPGRDSATQTVQNDSISIQVQTTEDFSEMQGQPQRQNSTNISIEDLLLVQKEKDELKQQLKEEKQKNRELLLQKSQNISQDSERYQKQIDRMKEELEEWKQKYEDLGDQFESFRVNVQENNLGSGSHLETEPQVIEKIVEKIVEKEIEVPVEKIVEIEKIVEVPIEVIKEIEVEKIIYKDKDLPTIETRDGYMQTDEKKFVSVEIQASNEIKNFEQQYEFKISQQNQEIQCLLLEDQPVPEPEIVEKEIEVEKIVEKIVVETEYINVDKIIEVEKIVNKYIEIEKMIEIVDEEKIETLENQITTLNKTISRQEKEIDLLKKEISQIPEKEFRYIENNDLVELYDYLDDLMKEREDIDKRLVEFYKHEKQGRTLEPECAKPEYAQNILLIIERMKDKCKESVNYLDEGNEQYKELQKKNVDTHNKIKTLGKIIKDKQLKLSSICIEKAQQYIPKTIKLENRGVNTMTEVQNSEVQATVQTAEIGIQQKVQMVSKSVQESVQTTTRGCQTPFEPEVVEKIIEIEKEVEVVKIKEVIKKEIVPKIIEKIVEKEVIVEKIVEREVEVEKIIEKIIEKPIEIIKYVDKIVEVIKTVEIKVPAEVDQNTGEKVVIKEVLVEVPVEKIVEKIIEKPVIQEKIVEKIVYRDRPDSSPKQIENQNNNDNQQNGDVVIKEVIKEVPVIQEKEVIKEVPVEVIKEVIKEVYIYPQENEHGQQVIEKIVEKEVKVPYEVIKEVQVIKEIPKEIIKEVQVIKEIEVIKYLPAPGNRPENDFQQQINNRSHQNSVHQSSQQEDNNNKLVIQNIYEPGDDQQDLTQKDIDWVVKQPDLNINNKKSAKVNFRVECWNKGSDENYLLSLAQIGIKKTANLKGNQDLSKVQPLKIQTYFPYYQETLLKIGIAWNNNQSEKIGISSSIVLLNNKGAVIDSINISNKYYNQNSVKHSGIIKMGVYDEEIAIRLNELDEEVDKMVLLITAVKSMTDISQGLIQIMENSQICYQIIFQDNGNAHAYIPLSFFRDLEGSWKLQKLGKSEKFPQFQMEKAIQYVQSTVGFNKKKDEESFAQNQYERLQNLHYKWIPGSGKIISMDQNKQIILPPQAYNEEIYLALGWDLKIDIDSSIIMIAKNGEIFDNVNFNSQRSKDNSIIHQSGQKQGEDIIKIDLQRISPVVQSFWVFLSVFEKGKSLINHENIYARIIISEEEFCIYQAKQLSKQKQMALVQQEFNGLLLCQFVRLEDQNKWAMRSRGFYTKNTATSFDALPILRFIQDGDYSKIYTFD